MNKCEWCNKVTSELFSYTDAIGEEHKICQSCKNSVDACECRKCGTVTDPSMMIDGLCTTCIQVKLRDKSKRQEEVRMGIDAPTIEETGDLELTDEDYERWMLLGKNFSPNDMKSVEMRRLWIMVKFNAAGIYDNKTISENLENIEILLERNFSKLVNNKCRIIIGNTAENRQIVKQAEVIDYEDEAYILKVI